MKREEVTGPVLLHIISFWDSLMFRSASHTSTGHWIEQTYSLLGLLDEIHEKEPFGIGGSAHRINEYRIGSKWSDSKFYPSVDFQGNFFVCGAHPNLNPNQTNPQDYQEAEEAAKVFTQTNQAFLQYCDAGNFDPKRVLSDYERLDGLLQEAYNLIKEGRRANSRPVYDTVIDHIAGRAGLDREEMLTTRDRLGFPLFLYDNQALEALVGLEFANSRSRKKLGEMDKDYRIGHNPYYRMEYNVWQQFFRTQDERLRSYAGDEGVIQIFGKLPQPERGIVIARTLHNLHSGNGFFTNGYRQNVNLGT